MYLVSATAKGSGDGANARIAAAHRSLSRIADKAEGRLDETIATLDRALAEVEAAARGGVERGNVGFASRSIGYDEDC